jgi:hypothetical protein
LVQFVGFTRDEEKLVESYVDRFGSASYCLRELQQIEKFSLPGYNGRVVAVPSVCGLKLPTTMYLAVCLPFTIVHELAHVSDMSRRRQETISHIGAEMPGEWHLSHRMSSEYYANRVACEHVREEEVFPAFISDLNGLKKAFAGGDWPSLLIYYALILGIFHGLGRTDCDPLALLGTNLPVPEAVVRAAEAFRAHSVDFFANYG